MDNAVLCLFFTSTLSPTQAATPGIDPVLIFLQNKAGATRHAKAEAVVRGGKRNPSLPFVAQEDMEGNEFALEL